MGYNDWDDEYEDDMFSAYGIGDIEDFEDEENMDIYKSGFQDDDFEEEQVVEEEE